MQELQPCFRVGNLPPTVKAFLHIADDAKPDSLYVGHQEYPLIENRKTFSHVDSRFNPKNIWYLDSNGQTGIYHAEGSFDGWGVFLWEPDGNGDWIHYMPKDCWYFEQLFILAYQHCNKYSPLKVWNSCHTLYEIGILSNGIEVCDATKQLIRDIATKDYPDDSQIMIQVLAAIYYGMVAEEHKLGTTLGASIKINGIYDLLFGEKHNIGVACNCTKGLSADEIRQQCDSRGLISHHW